MKALDALSDFQTLNDPQLEEMKRETARFITAYKRAGEKYWLTLLGSSGAGKTMLARNIHAICGGRFYSWLKIARMLREGEYRWFEDLFTLDLLIVDDAGAEYQTGFIASKLYELLSERVRRWTVLTSNLSLKAIGDLDLRIASRMIRHNSVVVDVDVPDWNLRK